MSIDTAKVHEWLLQDDTTGWQETVRSVRPYRGELEVEAAVQRLLRVGHPSPLTDLHLRRLLVTLIAPKEAE